MHVFILILAIAGEPEHLMAVCETYKQCSDKGEAIAEDYEKEYGKLPRDVSFRVEGAQIVRETSL